MTALRNTRHEAVLALYIQGIPREDCYRKVYGHGGPKVTARLFGRPDVQARLAEMQDECNLRRGKPGPAVVVFDRMYILQRLDAIARAAESVGEFQCAIVATVEQGKLVGGYTEAEAMGRRTALRIEAEEHRHQLTTGAAAADDIETIEAQVISESEGQAA